MAAGACAPIGSIVLWSLRGAAPAYIDSPLPPADLNSRFDWSVPCVLVALGVVHAWTALNFDGTSVVEFNLSLLGVGIISAIAWTFVFRRGRAPRLGRWTRGGLLLLPAYALFQVIPIPLALIRLISPHRAEVHEMVSQAVQQPAFTSISVLSSATIVYVLQIAFYASVFLLVRELTWRSSGHPWVMVAPVLLVAAGEAMLGWAHYIAAAGAAPASGTFINRNHFAGMLEMSLPFAVMYGLAALRGHRNRVELSTRAALSASLGFGLAMLILMGIVFSFSRSGFSAALAGLLAMAGLGGGQNLSPQVRKGANALVLLAVAAAFFLLPPDALIQRFADVSSLEEVRSQDRLELWSETWELVKAYPLVGCGLGAYRAAFLEFKVTTPMVTDDYAHNDYLQCLAEMGVLGALIVAVLFFGFVRSALIARTRLPTVDGRYLAIACFGAMFSIALHSVTDFNLYIPANAMLFAWIAGVASGLEAFIESR